MKTPIAAVLKNKKINSQNEIHIPEEDLPGGKKYPDYNYAFKEFKIDPKQQQKVELSEVSFDDGGDMILIDDTQGAKKEDGGAKLVGQKKPEFNKDTIAFKKQALEHIEKFKVLEKRLHMNDISEAVVAMLGLFVALYEVDLFFDRNENNERYVMTPAILVLRYIVFILTLILCKQQFLRFIMYFICIVGISTQHGWLSYQIFTKSGRNIMRVNFINSKQLKLVLLECLLNSVHTNPIFDGFLVADDQTSKSGSIRYSLDSLLVFVMIFRVYLIARLLTRFTIWRQKSAYFKCIKEGIEADTEFSIKALLQTQPYTVLFTMLIFSCIVLGFMLRQVEIVLYEDSDFTFISPDDKVYQNFTYHMNAMWLVIVTMTTVGFGDFYARTYAGKAITMMSCFIGSFIVSLMVVSMDTSSRFDIAQKKSYNAIKSYDNYLAKKNIAAKYIVKAIKLYQFKKQLEEDIFDPKLHEEILTYQILKNHAREEFKQFNLSVQRDDPTDILKIEEIDQNIDRTTTKIIDSIRKNSDIMHQLSTILVSQERMKLDLHELYKNLKKLYLPIDKKFDYFLQKMQYQQQQEQIGGTEGKKALIMEQKQKIEQQQQIEMEKQRAENEKEILQGKLVEMREILQMKIKEDLHKQHNVPLQTNSLGQPDMRSALQGIKQIVSYQNSSSSTIINQQQPPQKIKPKMGSLPHPQASKMIQQKSNLQLLGQQSLHPQKNLAKVQTVPYCQAPSKDQDLVQTNQIEHQNTSTTNEKNLLGNSLHGTRESQESQKSQQSMISKMSQSFKKMIDKGRQDMQKESEGQKSQKKKDDFDNIDDMQEELNREEQNQAASIQNTQKILGSAQQQDVGFTMQNPTDFSSKAELENIMDQSPNYNMNQHPHLDYEINQQQMMFQNNDKHFQQSFGQQNQDYLAQEMQTQQHQNQVKMTHKALNSHQVNLVQGSKYSQPKLDIFNNSFSSVQQKISLARKRRLKALEQQNFN